MNYIYHIFSNKKSSVYDFKSYPIVLSIATLRNFDQDSPIFVIDKTPQFHDWDNFPKKFKFQIITNCKKEIKDLPLIQNRLFDINNLLPFIDNDITYVDSDIFWINQFTPQINNDQISLKIKKNKNYWYANSGFFYFKKNTLGHKYFEEWEETLRNWKKQRSLLCFLKNFYGSNNDYNIGDEGLMGYLINRQGWLDKINPCIEPILTGENPKKNKFNLIHMLSYNTKNKISKAFQIKEINKILKKNLNKREIKNFGFDEQFNGNLNLKDFMNQDHNSSHGLDKKINKTNIEQKYFFY